MQLLEDPLDPSHELDPAARHKLVTAQLLRGQSACHAMEGAVATAVVLDLQRVLSSPVDAAKVVLKTVELFGHSMGLALLIDAVDAICMISAGVCAVAAQYAPPVHTAASG
jgi:hypothetical protein